MRQGFVGGMLHCATTGAPAQRLSRKHTLTTMPCTCSRQQRMTVMQLCSGAGSGWHPAALQRSPHLQLLIGCRQVLVGLLAVAQLNLGSQTKSPKSGMYRKHKGCRCTLHASV